MLSFTHLPMLVMQARLRCGRDKTWLHNSQSNASSNIIVTMFELAVVSGDASTRLAYRLFEDGMSWKLLSEWQYLEELVCSRHGALTELYVSMTDHMKTALRSAEDFVGTQHWYRWCFVTITTVAMYFE